MCICRVESSVKCTRSASSLHKAQVCCGLNLPLCIVLKLQKWEERYSNVTKPLIGLTLDHLLALCIRTSTVRVEWDATTSKYYVAHCTTTHCIIMLFGFVIHPAAYSVSPFLHSCTAHILSLALCPFPFLQRIQLVCSLHIVFEYIDEHCIPSKVYMSLVGVLALLCNLADLCTYTEFTYFILVNVRNFFRSIYHRELLHTQEVFQVKKNSWGCGPKSTYLLSSFASQDTTTCLKQCNHIQKV